MAVQETLVVAIMPRTVDTDFSKDYNKPKTEPSEVVKAGLQAIIDEVEDVYPRQEAQEAIAQLSRDRKSLEKQFAQILPSS